MFKSNKKKILDFVRINTAPLLNPNSKGETKVKKNIRIKKIEDINGMQISYGIIKKKN